MGGGTGLFIEAGFFPPGLGGNTGAGCGCSNMDLFAASDDLSPAT